MFFFICGNSGSHLTGVKNCVTVAPEPTMGFIHAQERCAMTGILWNELIDQSCDSLPQKPQCAPITTSALLPRVTLRKKYS